MKKSKIAYLITTLCLMVCTLFIGVWAAKGQANVGMSGNITFTGIGVNATLKIEVEGDQTHTSKTTLYETTITPGQEDIVLNSTVDTKYNLAFTTEGNPIKFTITIGNLLKTKDIYVKVTDKTNGQTTNLTTRILQNGTENNLATIQEQTGTNPNTAVFTVILSPTNLKNEIPTGSEYNIGINMSIDEIKAIDSSDIYEGTNQFTNSKEYYVNMGKFPQTFAGAGDLPNGVQPGTTLTDNGTMNIGTTVGVREDYVAGGNVATYRTEEKYTTYAIQKDLNTGREYVQAYVDPCLGDYTYSDGTPVGDSVDYIANASTAWFELEPIQWLILGYYTNEECITENYVGRYKGDGTTNANENFNPYQIGIKLKLMSNRALTAMAMNTYDTTDGAKYTGSALESWLNDGDDGFLSLLSDNEKSALLTGNDDGTNKIGINAATFDDDDGGSDACYNQQWQKTKGKKVWVLSVSEFVDGQSFAWAYVGEMVSDNSKRLMASDFGLAHSMDCETDGQAYAYYTRTPASENLVTASKRGKLSSERFNNWGVSVAPSVIISV